MTRKNRTCTSSNGRRSISGLRGMDSENTWREIKNAIDDYNDLAPAYVLDGDALGLDRLKHYCSSTLMRFDLWDTTNDRPDKEAIKDFYMRNS